MESKEGEKASFEEVLAALRAEAGSQSEKGTLFERLMVAVLPQLQEREVKDCWLWSEWPNRGRITGLGANDIGIDLIAEKNNGELVAVQCKFYESERNLPKGEVDKFLSASSKDWVSERLLISTTDNFSKNLEDTFKGQQIEVQRLNIKSLDTDYSIDWDRANPLKTKVKGPAKKELFERQKEGLKKVLSGFKQADRGKLIMACGTGKTFTSLNIAEKQVGNGGRILFLVPSISLLSQTLHEWAWQRKLEHSYLAVCSDTSVGRNDEGMRASELAIPATTNAHKIKQEMNKPFEGLQVIFSTYQSLERINEAQAMGAPAFDLVICDEAHRTTGIEGNQFTKIHDKDFIKASKRLYMTATPRIYADSEKTKAKDKDIEIYSMDDNKTYGDEFYRLDFSLAVAEGLLSDYRVLVLAIDEKYISENFQEEMSDGSQLALGDAAKIVGCYKALRDQGGKYADSKPLKRAVSFSSTIKSSKLVSEEFQQVVEQLSARESDGFTCRTEHVDGTMNSYKRKERLSWLQRDSGTSDEGEAICNILSNAKCLTEGVDVPALDAVLFMNPRRSQVDVVQAVGRVMRRAEGKKYGYVILPVVIPAGKTPEEALDDNNTYAVVWEVLRALRSHDDRFDAIINSIDLNEGDPPNVDVIGIGSEGDEEGDEQDTQAVEIDLNKQLEFDLPEEYRKAIYAKLVEKVGNRRYWENWAKDVAKIYEVIVQRIKDLNDKQAQVKKTFDEFHAGIKQNINDSLMYEEAISMLAQHLITRPVFDALFKDYAFSQNNPVSLSMAKVLAVMDKHGLDNELKDLEKFYNSVKERAAGIDNAAGRQKVIIELYEKFFKTAFAETAERLGIAYTPIEIVDFILASANAVLKKEFERGLTDENVHIIDPFTGTGSFINRLIENEDLIKQKDLKRKFSKELHANEILLLAYYIASVNIENAYYDRIKGNYESFPGIVLTDTFNLFERAEGKQDDFFPENNARLNRQRKAPIRVVVGNPPWSIGQKSENDANKNLPYPKLDQSIRESYVALSNAKLSKSLADSYVRAIRWASNRIGEEGVVAFVTNGGFLDGSSTDGLRKSLAEEFDAIYCLNARGYARTSGKQRRKEKDSIFGQSTRALVAITLLIKNPKKPRKQAEIYYHDIGDYLSRDQKLKILTDAKSINGLKWQKIKPNPEGDWINQRDPLFQTFIALGSNEVKRAKVSSPDTIFQIYGNGVVTSRDPWAYNFDRSQVEDNMKRMIDFYHQQLEGFQKAKKQNPQLNLERFIDNDSKKINWSRRLKKNLSNNKISDFTESHIRQSLYRPFTKAWFYFDKDFNEEVYYMPSCFPTADTNNQVIAVSGVGASKDFSTLISNTLLDIQVMFNGQCFPRYFWDSQGDKQDNITNFALKTFRAHYNNPRITRDDIFHYVYGLLHAPAYRERFAADLKKELPRIPLAPDFKPFRDAGKKLAALHLNYETATEYPLELMLDHKRVMPDIALTAKDYEVKRMRWLSKNDKTRIIVNERLQLAAVPSEALDYVVNGRSALDWVLERYQLKRDTASEIINDPNTWNRAEPDYIIRHLRRVAHVSVETTKILNELASLKILTK